MSYVGQQLQAFVMSFLIVFDIPRSEMTEKRRIHRELVRGGAEKIQDSFWKSDKIKFLIDVGMSIRKIGGRATILEEKFLF